MQIFDCIYIVSKYKINVNLFVHNKNGDFMKFRLGYVSMSLTLDEICHFHTLTYTSYQKLGIKKGNLKLDNIINENLNTLETILKYNVHNHIYFYRISHHIIPLASHKNVKFDYIDPYKKQWLKIGNYIKENNIRIDIHPDQYCVLNSINPEVVSNSKEILKFNQKLFNTLHIPGKVILHVGSSINGKEESKQRFIEHFLSLSSSLQKMILLENDDKVYNIIDVLEICEKLKIPMVLDYHHYICNHKKEKLKDYLPRIFNTWKNTSLNPKIHFSSPKSKKEKRSHSTYIILKDFLKMIDIMKDFNQDIDIMLECKGKDEALFRLSRQLKEITYIKCVDNSTFEIEKDYKI